jgi:hypothetical protein
VNIRSGRVLPGRLKRGLAAPANALPWYGLAIFTFFFVTQRLPELFTELGIYSALLGLVLRPQDLGFPQGDQGLCQCDACSMPVCSGASGCFHMLSTHLSKVSTMVPARRP